MEGWMYILVIRADFAVELPFLQRIICNTNIIVKGEMLFYLNDCSCMLRPSGHA